MDTAPISTVPSPTTSDRRFGKREPWPHTCIECGREFLSACRNSRLRCHECQKEARRRQHAVYDRTEKGKEAKRRSSKTYRERHKEQCSARTAQYHKERREELAEKQRARYWQNAEMERLKSKLRWRIRHWNDKKAEFEYGRLLGRLQTCPRLHVTAASLPCGKRPECWGGKPCEKCEGMKRPRDYGFGQWEF